MTRHPFLLFSLIIVSSLLSACSIESMADKILPEHIKQESTEIVDAVMEGDTQFFIQRKADLLSPDLLETVSDEEFEESIVNAFSNAGANTEVSRYIVGVSANVSASLGEGSTKTYETIYELETSEGFVLISLRLANRSGTNECCEIKSIDVRDYKTSPIRAGLTLTKKVFTFLGVFVIGVSVILGFLFFRRRKKKNALSNT